MLAAKSSRSDETAYVPDTGDLIWTDFDPIKGREQAGRRPALVVSSAEFTQNTGLAIVCPVTSRIHPFPTSVVLPPHLPIRGEILLSHLRSIDTQARPVRYTDVSITGEMLQLVRAKLAALLTI
jgi:mRNA interferase MazF